MALRCAENKTLVGAYDCTYSTSTLARLPKCNRSKQQIGSSLAGGIKLTADVLLARKLYRMFFKNYFLKAFELQYPAIVSTTRVTGVVCEFRTT